MDDAREANDELPSGADTPEEAPALEDACDQADEEFAAGVEVPEGATLLDNADEAFAADEDVPEVPALLDDAGREAEEEPTARADVPEVAAVPELADALVLPDGARELPPLTARELARDVVPKEAGALLDWTPLEVPPPLEEELDVLFVVGEVQPKTNSQPVAMGNQREAGSERSRGILTMMPPSHAHHERTNPRRRTSFAVRARGSRDGPQEAPRE